MEICNKKILLVCKETYSYPLYYLAQKWMKSNKVAAFFFNPVETMYNSCLLNDTTYYAFKKIQNITIYNSDGPAKAFTDILDSESYDEEWLKHIEERYSHFANVNNQIMSTQFLTRHYHFRNYMYKCTYAQQLNWLILNYKNIINIFDEYKPDVVFDTDSAELARCIIREICYFRNIPYVTVGYARYEFYLMYTFNLNQSTDLSFVESYHKHFASAESNLEDEIKYVSDFRIQSSIMNDMYKNDVTSQYRPDSYWKVFKKIVGEFYYFWNQDITAKNLSLKRSNKVLYNDSLQFLQFFLHYEFLKQRLMKSNPFFKKPVEGENYVYMPLHLIPESSTFSVAPMYVNELTIIEAVSKSLPAGWWLYVKEHQAMLGERATSFYKLVNRLPNVKMVQLNYYQDPKPWIMKSKGVVTISGTTAYEAALLQRHAIVFSDVPFKLIEGIMRCRSFEDLPQLLKNFTTPLDNIKSCAAYIAAVKKMGVSVNIKLLLNEALGDIRNHIEPSKEYRDNLNRLEELLLKGYQYYIDHSCQK